MNDTIAAISTNNFGMGAINIIRISGKDAIKIISQIFSKKNIISAKSHTIHYGYILDGDTIIDEVLVSIMRAPKTYTLEDVVEINCHGGYAPTKKILELVLTHKARLAEPGEFTKRAFLNGRINLMEAESVNDLLQAKTESQRTLAINSLSGKTTKLIQQLREQMVNLLANIEVNIDYPEYEDELIITKNNIKPILTNIKDQLQKIIKESQNGQKIKNGINIAIIGKPNVGKSSLLNTLLEEEKAIVTDISGTTRDVIEGSIIYNGVPLNFFDTAGIRKTSDVIEQIGVKKSQEIIKNVDLTVLVLNNNEKITLDEQKLINEITRKKAIIFINKNDLPKKLEPISSPLKIIHGSTKNNEGIEQLKQQILQEFSISNITNQNLIYLANTRQISLAKQALNNVNHVIEENKKQIPIDMLAIELKEAWENLGKIIGEYYEEELIDNLFAKFCLGK